MSKVNCIRQMRREGVPIAVIAKTTGVSRDTVYKYVAQEDFSPSLPAGQARRASKLDAYKPIIDQWLDDDEREWRKQRHTVFRQVFLNKRGLHL